MRLMERPTGLILSVLCAGLVSGLSETARLEIMGPTSFNTDEDSYSTTATISVTTECKCQNGQNMEFNIDDKYLPDLDDLDVLASKKAPVRFRWDKKSIMCGGTLTHNLEEKKLQVSFQIDRKCGVDMPNDRTPQIIAKAEEDAIDRTDYHGNVMEANLQFVYTTPAGQNKHMTALLACSCEDETPEFGPCHSEYFQINYSHKCDKDGQTGTLTTDGCSLKIANLDGCPLTEVVTNTSDTNPTVQGKLGFDGSNQEECDAVKDRGTFYEIKVEYAIETNMNLDGTDIGPLKSEKEMFHTCKKPAKWSEWSNWGKCQGKCGEGRQARSRICHNGIAGLPGCYGKSVETLTCQMDIDCQLACPAGTKAIRGGAAECWCGEISFQLGAELYYILYPHVLIPKNADIELNEKGHPKLALNSDTHFVATLREVSPEDATDYKDRTTVFISLPNTNIGFYLNFETSSFESEHSMVGFRMSDNILWTFQRIFPLGLGFAETEVFKDGAKVELSTISANLSEPVVFLSSTASENDGKADGNGNHFRSHLRFVALPDSDAPFEVTITTKLLDKTIFCKDQEKVPFLISNLDFQPHCERTLGSLICTTPEKPTCPPLDSPSVDPNRLSNEHLSQFLNKLQGDKICFDFCDPETLEVSCTTDDGISVSLNNYQSCGDCGPCHQLEYTCQNGAEKYQFHSCNACKQCAAEDLTSEWSNWSACTEECSTGNRSRVRSLKPMVDLVNLDCTASSIDIDSLPLSATEDCNTRCCGWTETWSAWAALFLDKDVCHRERVKTITCDDALEQPPTETISEDDTCYRPTVDCPVTEPDCNKLLECTTDTPICDDLTKDGDSIMCLSNDGTKCCKSIEDSEPDWSSCIGTCAYAKQTAIVSRCGAKVVIAKDEFCKTGNTHCTCDLSYYQEFPSRYSCVPVLNSVCIPHISESSDGIQVSQQCTLKDEFKGETDCEIFEVPEPCVVQECSEEVTSNCCDHLQCMETNGASCEQPSRICYDTEGKEMESETTTQDCCDGEQPCTTEQVTDLCPPCDSTFPKCLDDPEMLLCMSGETKCTHDPSSCQCGDFECGTDSFTLPVVTNDVLEQMHLDLPDVLYSSKLRFFLGQDGTNWNTSFCYHIFDRNDPEEEMKLTYSYSQAKECNAFETKHNQKSVFQVALFVDGNKVNHNTLGTHTKFAKISCEIPDPEVLSRTLHVVPRFMPMEITEVIEAGKNQIEFELASDPGFTRLLNNEEKMANAHLVGEHVYARIRGKGPIKLLSCYIRSLDNDMSEIMIEDGCIKPTMKSAFQMQFIETGNHSEVQVMWQNFYFRSLTTPRQRVSYDCSVGPCLDPPCNKNDCDAPDTVRKRRSLDGKAPKLETDVQNPKSDEDDPVNGKLRFWIDVFKTQNDLSRARNELDKWEKDRDTAFIMKHFALITSSILLIVTVVLGCVMIRRIMQKRAVTGKPRIFRQTRPIGAMRNAGANNNIGIENKAFDISC